MGRYRIIVGAVFGALAVAIGWYGLRSFAASFQLVFGIGVPRNVFIGLLPLGAGLVQCVLAYQLFAMARRRWVFARQFGRAREAESGGPQG